MSHDPHADSDMFRPVFADGAPMPCGHTWRWVDEYDVWYCTSCKRTESPDDDHGDAA